MKQYTGIILVAAAVILLGGAVALQSINRASHPAPFDEVVVVYMTPNCGCCAVYAEYLSRRGIAVEREHVSGQRVADIKEEHGIAHELFSCHLSFVRGYLVVGHVPIEVIEQLLEDSPRIVGIALPGMPSGTPGMPGPKVEEWIIYAVEHDGTVYEFMSL